MVVLRQARGDGMCFQDVTTQMRNCLKNPDRQQTLHFHGKKSLKISQSGIESPWPNIPADKAGTGQNIHLVIFTLKVTSRAKQITGCIHITGKSTGSHGTFAAFSISCQKDWQRLVKVFYRSQSTWKNGGFKTATASASEPFYHQIKKGALWFDGFSIGSRWQGNGFQTGTRDCRRNRSCQ